MATVRYYETLYAVRPDVEEEQLASLRQRIEAAIGKHEGEIVKHDKWAERELAYPIDNHRKATYYIVVFKALPPVAPELEKVFRSAIETVLRFIVVQRDEITALKTAGLDVSHLLTPRRRKRREANLIVRKKYGRYHFDKLTPEDLDYKNVELLQNFITERKKIVPRRTSGLSSYGQRLLSNAIKRARVMALLPFTVLHD